MLPPLNLNPKDERDTDARAVPPKRKDDELGTDSLALHDSVVDTEVFALMAQAAFGATEFMREAAQNQNAVTIRDNPEVSPFSFFTDTLKSSETYGVTKCIDGKCDLTLDYSDAAYATSLLKTGKIPSFDTNGHWDVHPEDEKRSMEISQEILDSPVWESFDAVTGEPIESWGYVMVSKGRQASLFDAPVPGHATLVIESPTMEPNGKVAVGSYGFFPELPGESFEEAIGDQLKNALLQNFGPSLPMQFWVGDQSYMRVLKGLKDSSGALVKDTKAFSPAHSRAVARFKVNAALIAVLRGIQRYGDKREGKYKVKVNEINGFDGVKYNVAAWLAKPMMQLDMWMHYRGQGELIGNCATALADVLQNVYGRKIAHFAGGIPVGGSDSRYSMNNIWYTLTHITDHIDRYERSAMVRDYIARKELGGPNEPINFEDPKLAFWNYLTEQAKKKEGTLFVGKDADGEMQTYRALLTDKRESTHTTNEYAKSDGGSYVSEMFKNVAIALAKNTALALLLE